MSSLSHPHANTPPFKTARASRAASARTAAVAAQGESKLENLLFHRGGFSYAFYCMLLSYVEWSGALLSSCARFHAQAPPNKYPRISRPEDYHMEIGLLHAVMGQECENSTFDRVKRLTIRGARGEFPPVVRPTNVSRPWFPNAQAVSFDRSPFDNIVWKHFPKLHTLDLSHMSVDEFYSPMRGIHNCPCLTNLDVSFTQIDIQGMIYRLMPNTLKTLNLSGNVFLRNDLVSLISRQHKSLTSLDISHGEYITPEMIERAFSQSAEILRSVKRDLVVVLQELKMNSLNHNFDDADWSRILRAVIRNCPELVTLEMAYNSGAGPLCCAELGRSGIESLLVDNCEDMWEFHTYFRNSRMSKTLKKLVARENDQIRTESIMNFLGCCYQRIGLGCESLVHVDLSNCPNLRSGPLCALAKVNPGLQTFIIRGSKSREITDVVLSALGKHCPKLVCVDFTGINACDRSVICLAQGCPALEVVKWGATRTTDRSLQALAQHCKSLRHLEVQFRDNQYTERGFILSCNKLETLKITWENPSFNPDLILAAFSGLPRLFHVKLRGSGFVHITDEACIQFIQDTPTLYDFDPATFAQTTRLRDLLCRISDNDPDQERNPDSAKYFARARTYKALRFK